MSVLTAQNSPSSIEEERRAHEPSMEEILASIRRIIADDESTVSVRSQRGDRPSEAAADNRRRVEPEPPPAPVATLAPTLPHGAEVDHYEAVADYEDDRSINEEPLIARIEESISADRPALQEAISAVDELETQTDDLYAPDDAEQGYYEEEPEAYAAVETAAPLVSPDAAASITAQFQSLAASMVINDSGLLHDYAREMLRPMLKAWLDDNLPVLVERLVRAEIERVARGGRR